MDSKLHLYLISRGEGAQGSDTYTEAVVVAASSDAARLIHPEGHTWSLSANDWVDSKGSVGSSFYDSRFGWVEPGQVIVKYLGEAGPDLAEGEIVIAAFKNG